MGFVEEQACISYTISHAKTQLEVEEKCETPRKLVYKSGNNAKYILK